MSKDIFVDVIPECYSMLLDSTYHYLLSYGYINYGVALVIKDRIPAKPSNGRVIVIRASLAGLVASRQLTLFRFEVTFLEGQNRAGGRVYKKRWKEGIRW